MPLTYELSEIDMAVNYLLDHCHSHTLLFYGEMGVGKTTLIKAILKNLGVKDTVSSPSFSLVNEYQLPNTTAYHFDFYRIEEESEALDIGIEHYFEDETTWKLIEWPNKIENLLENSFQKVSITANPNGLRLLKLS